MGQVLQLQFSWLVPYAVVKTEVQTNQGPIDMLVTTHSTTVMLTHTLLRFLTTFILQHWGEGLWVTEWEFTQAKLKANSKDPVIIRSFNVEGVGVILLRHDFIYKMQTRWNPMHWVKIVATLKIYRKSFLSTTAKLLSWESGRVMKWHLNAIAPNVFHYVETDTQVC